jgi:gas vesicle protein
MIELLKTLAPMIGTALGGPLGGAAAAFIADKLGIESKTVEAVTEVLNSGKMTPEQVAQIKLAEIEFQKFLKQNAIDLEKVHAEDRGSARAMQVATHSKMPAILTMIVTVGFFGILVLLILHPEFKSNEIVLIMIGQLSVAWAGCIAFYTGTTFGSANKNALIANNAQPR